MTYIYPALHQPPSGLRFTDQFAFRPTGSTVAALIALSHTVLTKLSTNHYVHVFSHLGLHQGVRHRAARCSDGENGATRAT